MSYFNDFDDNNLDAADDVNRKNEDAYNNMIEHVKNNQDEYWDRNNPIIKLLLTILFIIAIVGFIYYFVMWLKVR